MHALVDALIKGRAVHKRGTNEYFSGKGKAIKSCAVGAIYYGLYGKVPSSETPPQMIPTSISGDWPQFRSHMTDIPCEHKENQGDRGNIAGILIHLNDKHPKDFPDKKIEAWLEKVLGEYDPDKNMPQMSNS